MSEVEQYILTKKSMRTLMSYSLKLTMDTTEARDLFQDAMLKALTKKSSFKAGTNVSAWLHTIVRNEYIDKFRKKTKYSISNIDDEFDVTSSSADQISMLSYKDIVYQINKLEGKYRIPFNLFVQGYKYEHIAEELKLPMGTVKSRIFSARQILSSCLTR